MNWFQRQIVKLAGLPAPDDDFWYRPVSAAAMAGGQYVDPIVSLQSVTYYACVRLLSESIASQPIGLWAVDANGAERPFNDHPAAWLFQYAPNEEQTTFEFFEQLSAHLCSWGNAYAWIEYDSKRNPSALRLICPDKCEAYRDKETGRKAFKVTEGTRPDIVPDTEDRILHVPGIGSDGIRGWSPVGILSRAIGSALSADQYGAAFFANNATPLQYVTFPNSLSGEARSAIGEWLKANHGGPANWHKPGVFEQGGEIKTVPVNHRDIQFLELRKFNVEEIARIFRVPLHLIQSLDRSTNNNIEHQGIDFGTYTIRPWNERIEARLNRSLLGPRQSQRLYFRFDMDAIMRGDAASRASYYSTLRNIGAINANEIRAKENLGNAYAGGDVYMVQGAMIPVDMAGKTQGGGA